LVAKHVPVDEFIGHYLKQNKKEKLKEVVYKKL